MKKYEFYIDSGYTGCEYKEVVEFEDDVTEKELEETVREILFKNIEFGYNEVDEEVDK